MAPPSGPGLEELNKLVETSLVLLANLEQSLQAITSAKDSHSEHPHQTTTPPPSTSTTAAASSSTSIDCLALARDSAKLAKSHATKISLFIINDPFTPQVIAGSVRDLAQIAVVALASAVQQCDSARYTTLMRTKLAWQSSKIIKQTKDLLNEIPKDGKPLPLPTAFKSLSRQDAQRATMQATGLLWSACDEVVDMAQLGIAGSVVKMAEQYRSSLKDVLEELQEWKEEVTDEADSDDSGVATGNTAVQDLAADLSGAHVSTQAMVDDLMDVAHTIPRGDPDSILPRLDLALRRLQMTVKLYQMLSKRRLKTLPRLPIAEAASESTVVSRLDEVMPLLAKMSDSADDLAGAFYSLDSGEISRLLDMCSLDAVAVSKLLAKTWDGQEDEFTQWVAKFQVEVARS